jgi:hypothetical protein
VPKKLPTKFIAINLLWVKIIIKTTCPPMVDLYYAKLMLGFEIMFFLLHKNMTRKTCGPKYTSTLKVKPMCIQSSFNT